MLHHKSTKALPGNPVTDNPVLELTSKNTIPGDSVNWANYESANEEKNNKIVMHYAIEMVSPSLQEKILSSALVLWRARD